MSSNSPVLPCLLIELDEAEPLALILKAIADCLGFRQPTVSHHLKMVTEADLLNRERRSTWSWYSVNYDGLN
ncbi:ArsR family transcriptional regulator [Streptomyces hirsutus]|uniref:ArsR family transcriptional regulator n=1 Tax=Streptomyces hirsutus TaxID=35620 RepID=UPI000ABE3A98|nr:ArsR family transcriptional regulator [Streptomyces hirsutus]